ncbi:La-related protein 6B [Capsicum annuum]|uniref:la-related protein 6B n=1 Tax=Capsicum annuum TaxID=4072 RepID=UPI001FB16B10|nr:la-related protein 6B [Capsicum annuum]KAF3645626.1 La-related protein 6B [Capsicum annuum]
MALEESAIAVDSLANSINPSVTSLSTSIINLDRQLDHAVPSPSSDPPSSTKLNALAPAFVPRTSLAPPAATATAFHPVRNHFGYTPQLSVQYPSPFYGGVAQEIAADLDHATQKIVNQVEFYFSDLNLATTDHLIRHMLKDPEGYVPISVVASFKKIKALISSHAQLAQVLQSSTKLVVSEDGMKVKCKIPLTETDLEELQSRIVIAENLPEDHCHQNLMKIFSAVGSVKMIRTCLPQSSNGGASSGSRTAKSDSMLYSNKLHTFVEYESAELAERAVVELNDANWRNALKVRLLKSIAKSGQAQGKKAGHETEQNFKGDDGLEVNKTLNEESRHHIDAKSNELSEHGGDGQRRVHGRGRGRGRGRGKGQVHPRPQFQQNNRGGILGAPISNVNRGSSVGNAPSNINHVGLGQPDFEQSAAAKQSSVPRMPDGTKGFSMGRGKPMAIITM